VSATLEAVWADMSAPAKPNDQTQELGLLEQ